MNERVISADANKVVIENGPFTITFGKNKRGMVIWTVLEPSPEGDLPARFIEPAKDLAKKVFQRFETRLPQTKSQEQKKTIF